MVTRVVEDIHHSINVIRIPSDTLFPNDSITEHFSITATIKNITVNIYNIYIYILAISIKENFFNNLEI